MKITLKDGSVREYDKSMSVFEIASDISEGLARVAMAGEVNGEVVDLRTVLSDDCELSILTFQDEGGKETFRHTSSHILAQAVKRLRQNLPSDRQLLMDFTMIWTERLRLQQRIWKRSKKR